MDSAFQRVQPSVVCADVRGNVKNKVPSARSETLLWLAECIQGSAAEALLKVHKDLVPILMEVGRQTD